jgi:hypothetical protein
MGMGMGRGRADLIKLNQNPELIRCGKARKQTWLFKRPC